MFRLFGLPIDPIVVLDTLWIIGLTLGAFIFCMGSTSSRAEIFNNVGEPIRRGRGPITSRLVTRRRRSSLIRFYYSNPRKFRILVFIGSAIFAMVFMILWWYPQIPHYEGFIGVQLTAELTLRVNMSMLIAGLCLIPIGLLVTRGFGKGKAPQPDRARSKLTRRLMDEAGSPA